MYKELKFSEDQHIQLNKIEEYLDEKIVKKNNLEKDLEDLRIEISTLGNQRSEIENARDLALHQKKIADLEIKSYTDTKRVLDKHNISINEDLLKFTNTINCIEEYGDNPERLIVELNDIQYLDGKKRALEIATEELEERTANLRQQEFSLEDKIYAHSENLPVYNQLAQMGFGSSPTENVA